MKDTKIIVTDVDGVLLNWEYAFNEWMEFNGYTPVEDYKHHYDIKYQYQLESRNKGHKLIREFNASAAIGFLPPLRDAQYYVKMLAEKHQYRFVVLTSLSLDPFAIKLRERNLVKLFGDIFEQVISLDTGAHKDQALIDLYNQYGKTYWLEDKPENVDAGIQAGFDGILVKHTHNLAYTGAAQCADTWAEIYQLITGGDHD